MPTTPPAALAASFVFCIFLLLLKNKIKPIREPRRGKPAACLACFLTAPCCVVRSCAELYMFPRGGAGAHMEYGSWGEPLLRCTRL